jgi:predicted nucleotidyltransferase
VQPASEKRFLSQWRDVLDRRVREATEHLARVDGVAGLILGGSLGSGEPWPLSDIDILPVYDDDRATKAAAEVASCRIALLEQWSAEGVRTPLDVGKLAFVRSEVEEALAAGSGRAVGYLADPRWFHGLDKGYRGKPVSDPTGVTAALIEWLTAARFDPAVVQARISRNRCQAEECLQEAVARLASGDADGTLLALHNGTWALLAGLMERWGVRDSSFARVGTRFERAAAACGNIELADRVLTLFNLAPAAARRRMDLAPERIRDRHRLSYRARLLVDEQVTPEQDARDVLLTFSSHELRYGAPPFAPWVGAETDPAMLRQHLDIYRNILAEL